MPDTSSSITITLIAAMAENRVIGVDGDLPWHLPADLAHFKRLTSGHPVLMGRRTFDSLDGPLPKRRNFVLTRRSDWSHPGVEVVHRLEDAFERLDPGAELFILGGEEVYRLALPLAHRIQLTLVHAQPEGDTRFPEFSTDEWALVDERHHPADAEHTHAMTFQRYERRV